MAEAKNVMTGKEQSLIMRALNVMKAQLTRAKVKEASDPDMVAIYDVRIAEVNNLMARISTKELF